MANVKISDLTDGTAVAAGDLVEIERPGTPNVSRKVPLGTAAGAASSAFATSAQGTTADAALPRSGGQMTGNITMAGAQTVDGRDLSADGTKLDGIEALADVTDATNVAAAGAVMESDTSTASMSFVIDEDNMASDSATKVPTQQSVKAYVDANTHDAVTVSDSSEIDFTLTGQQISASIVAGSIDETKLDTSVNASLDLADSALQSDDIGVTVQGYDADLATLASPTAWRVFYSNGSNAITQLALGADGTFLKSNGATSAPSFATPAGSGDVSKVGTPADNQIGVWTGDGTLEGDAALTFDSSTDSLVIAASGNLLFGAVTVLDDNAGTMTLSNIDALDATTEATIEAAIDTLANLTSIQGVSVTFGAYAATLLNTANEAGFKSAVNLEANTDFYAPSGTDVAVADGGTGASTAATARANLEIDGQQTIWVPAAAMTPRTTNGAASGSLETATNDVMAKYLAFDSTTSEGAQFAVQMPKSWNEGTIVAQFVWMHPSTATNFGVRWGIRAVAFANDDALDTAFGTEQEVTDTGGTTSDIYISDETAAMTVAGSPTAEELVVFEVYRDPADGGDTMAVDAYLLGVKIHYTTDAARDD